MLLAETNKRLRYLFSLIPNNSNGKELNVLKTERALIFYLLDWLRLIAPHQSVKDVFA